MPIVVVILSVLLALTFTGVGAPKIGARPWMLDRQAHLGVSARLTRIIGWLDVAAPVGLLIGLFWPRWASRRHRVSCS